MHFYKISTKLTVKYENAFLIFFLQSSKLTVKYQNAFLQHFYKVQSLQ